VDAHADEAVRATEVTAPEELMREHGVVNRVLLVYEAGLGKFARGEDFDVAILSRTADIVRQFIEGYHERNEEQQAFPRFRKAGQLVDLVDVLHQQHQAGRRLTDTFLGLVPASQAPGESRNRLIASRHACACVSMPPVLRGWVEAKAAVLVNVHPTHWRDWSDSSSPLFAPSIAALASFSSSSANSRSIVARFSASVFGLKQLLGCAILAFAISLGIGRKHQLGPQVLYPSVAQRQQGKAIL